MSVFCKDSKSALAGRSPTDRHAALRPGNTRVHRGFDNLSVLGQVSLGGRKAKHDQVEHASKADARQAPRYTSCSKQLEGHLRLVFLWLTQGSAMHLDNDHPPNVAEVELAAYDVGP